jgi:hypothetical protein
MSVDDRTKKLLAKCDSSFPGERVNALDLLYDHLQKIGQTFAGLVHEFEQAIPAQKYTDLEQLYNNAVNDNTAWAQRCQQKESALAAATRQVTLLKGMVWFQLNWGTLLSAAALLLAVLFGYRWLTRPAWPASADGDLSRIASRTTWGLGFDQPFVATIAGKPYWLLLRGEVKESGYVDNVNRPVVMRCLHIFAAPAEAESGQYHAAQPYAWGLLQWPERLVDCQKSPDQTLTQK